MKSGIWMWTVHGGIRGSEEGEKRVETGDSRRRKQPPTGGRSLAGWSPSTKATPRTPGLPETHFRERAHQGDCCPLSTLG